MELEKLNPGARARAAGARVSANAFQAGKSENSAPLSNTQAAVAVIREQDRTRRLVLKGRKLWALRELLAAGAEGVTPVTHPGPRWSDYVRKLRLEGLDIETVDEAHGGPYAGRHGRYVLHSDVSLEPLVEGEESAP